MFCWWHVWHSFLATMRWGLCFQSWAAFQCLKDTANPFSSSPSSSCKAHICLRGYELPFFDTVTHLGHLLHHIVSLTHLRYYGWLRRPLAIYIHTCIPVCIIPWCFISCYNSPAMLSLSSWFLPLVSLLPCSSCIKSPLPSSLLLGSTVSTTSFADLTPSCSLPVSVQLILKFFKTLYVPLFVTPSQDINGISHLSNFSSH